MPESAPRVPHIPRVQASYVVGNEEGGGREPHVGKYWIDVLGEGRVAVVKGEQELGMRDAGCGMRDALAELCECERPPARTRQRFHLTCKAGPRNPRDAELQGTTDAMIAQHWRPERGATLVLQFRIPHSAFRIGLGSPARPAPARQRGSCVRPARTR